MLSGRKDRTIVIVVVIIAVFFGCFLSVAIISAILFPAFIRARVKAQQVTCNSNLLKLAMGVGAYTNDFNEKLPTADRWMDVINPYIGHRRLLICPSAGYLKYGYAFYRPISGKKIVHIFDVSQTPLLYDSLLGKLNANDDGQSLSERHYGGANVGFVDFHVKWFSKGHARQFFRSPPKMR